MYKISWIQLLCLQQSTIWRKAGFWHFMNTLCVQFLAILGYRTPKIFQGSLKSLIFRIIIPKPIFSYKYDQHIWNLNVLDRLNKKAFLLLLSYVYKFLSDVICIIIATSVTQKQYTKEPFSQCMNISDHLLFCNVSVTTLYELKCFIKLLMY